MKLPDIAFSEWKEWHERSVLEEIDEPGVYVLAHFDNPPKRRANPLCREVIYIGETCDDTLLERLKTFNSARLNGRAPHSGGRTYFKIFNDNKAKLYVAIFPLGFIERPIQPLYIRYVERKLLLEYALKWGKLPVCNLK